MKTKICNKCKIKKSLNEFHNDKYTNDGKTTICKECRNNYNTNFRRTLKGFLYSIYKHQKETSKKRGHHPPLYTFEELCEWFVLQPNWEDLWLKYQSNNYDRNLAPSIDRLDDNKGYMFDNIRLITAYDNVYKQINKTKKSVNQYDLKGNYIQTFESISDASRITKIPYTSIRYTCKGKYKYAGGYQWRYLSDKFPKNKNINPI